MTRLQDLPSELTLLIAEEIGGGELRRDVRYLTLYRKWYESAYQVYHSGIHLSNISIFGCNVNRLGDVAGYSGERKLMHRNTRNIDIRVFGHWHDKTSESDYGLFPMDDIGIMKGVQERAEFDNDPFVFGERSEKDALREWQARVFNPRLQDLFGDLHKFTFLQNLTLQAMQGTESNGNPVEKFLTASTMRSLLSSLSLLNGLKSLMLDLCCETDSDNGEFHMCELLSKVLPRVEIVRLRLTCICPLIFKLDSDLRATDVRLKNLIIKLHLPRYPKCPVSPCYYAQRCGYGGLGALANLLSQTEHREEMVRGAKDFLEDIGRIRSTAILNDSSPPNAVQKASNEVASPNKMDHQMQLCRISYPDARNIVRVADCLTMRDGWVLAGWPLTEFFAHQDYGSPCWFEDDESQLAWGAHF